MDSLGKSLLTSLFQREGPEACIPPLQKEETEAVPSPRKRVSSASPFEKGGSRGIFQLPPSSTPTRIRNRHSRPPTRARARSPRRRPCAPETRGTSPAAGCASEYGQR